MYHYSAYLFLRGLQIHMYTTYTTSNAVNQQSKCFHLHHNDYYYYTVILRLTSSNPGTTSDDCQPLL